MAECPGWSGFAYGKRDVHCPGCREHAGCAATRAQLERDLEHERQARNAIARENAGRIGEGLDFDAQRTQIVKLEGKLAHLTVDYQEAEAQLTAARAEGERLREALDRDKTGLVHALNAIRNRVKAGWWITEGRGDYEWDDERYQKETGYVLAEVKQVAEDALRVRRSRVCRARRRGPSGEGGVAMDWTLEQFLFWLSGVVVGFALAIVLLDLGALRC